MGSASAGCRHSDAESDLVPRGDLLGPHRRITFRTADATALADRRVADACAASGSGMPSSPQIGPQTARRRRGISATPDARRRVPGLFPPPQWASQPRCATTGAAASPGSARCNPRLGRRGHGTREDRILLAAQAGSRRLIGHRAAGLAALCVSPARRRLMATSAGDADPVLPGLAMPERLSGLREPPRGVGIASGTLSVHSFAGDEGNQGMGKRVSGASSRLAEEGIHCGSVSPRSSSCC